MLMAENSIKCGQNLFNKAIDAIEKKRKYMGTNNLGKRSHYSRNS